MPDLWSSERAREARHKLLRLTANGDDPEMAELSREILAGHITFADSLGSSGYSEILLRRIQPMVEMWEGLPESERLYARDHADELLAEVLSGIEALPSEPPRPDHPDPPRAARFAEDDEDSFEHQTYLRRG